MNVYSDKVHSLLQVVAKQLDLTPREVERLVRDYKQRSLPSDIQKFNECGWVKREYRCILFRYLQTVLKRQQSCICII